MGRFDTLGKLSTAHHAQGPPPPGRGWPPWVVGGGREGRREGGGPSSLLPCLPPLTTQGGHPLPGGGGLCAWCAVLNFPAGINQGLDSLPPPTASALLQPPLVKTIPVVTAMAQPVNQCGVTASKCVQMIASANRCVFLSDNKC